MDPSSFSFLHVGAVRRAVVPAGDIRADIAFQNDINGLLARFDGKTPPLTALEWVQEPGIRTGELSSGPPQLRVIAGGGRRVVRALPSADLTPAPQVIVRRA